MLGKSDSPKGLAGMRKTSDMISLIDLAASQSDVTPKEFFYDWFCGKVLVFNITYNGQTYRGNLGKCCDKYWTVMPEQLNEVLLADDLVKYKLKDYYENNF